MSKFNISYMEHNDIKKSANVLSLAMLNNPLHIAVFQGNNENQRLLIEKMFVDLLDKRPGIVLVAKYKEKIIGVMRMISCVGKKSFPEPYKSASENDINYRQWFWLNEWAKRDPKDQHWHLGPIGVLPDYRKQGVGSQLMEYFCDEADKCLSKAYLETDFDENVIFYKKFGFQLIEKSTIFQVENKYMIRNPNIK